jgi:hypothetical protein
MLVRCCLYIFVYGAIKGVPAKPPFKIIKQEEIK